MLLCYIKSAQVTPTHRLIGENKTRATIPNSVSREIMTRFLRENGRPIEAEKNDERFLPVPSHPSPPPPPFPRSSRSRPRAAQRETNERTVGVGNVTRCVTIVRGTSEGGTGEIRAEYRVPRKRENKYESILSSTRYFLLVDRLHALPSSPPPVLRFFDTSILRAPVVVHCAF